MFLLLFDWGAFRNKKDLESGCCTYSYIGGAGHEMAMQGFEPTAATLKVKVEGCDQTVVQNMG